MAAVVGDELALVALVVVVLDVAVLAGAVFVSPGWFAFEVFPPPSRLQAAAIIKIIASDIKVTAGLRTMVCALLS